MINSICSQSLAPKRRALRCYTKRIELSTVPEWHSYPLPIYTPLTIVYCVFSGLHYWLNPLNHISIPSPWEILWLSLRRRFLRALRRLITISRLIYCYFCFLVVIHVVPRIGGLNLTPWAQSSAILSHLCFLRADAESVTDTVAG